MIRINESSLSLSEAIRAITPTGSARSKITPRLAELVATFPVSRLMIVINSNSKSVKRISIISKLPRNLDIDFLTRFCYERLLCQQLLEKFGHQDAPISLASPRTLRRV